MSTAEANPVKDGGTQCAMDTVDDVDSKVGELSTSLPHVVDALVSPTQVVQTSTITTSTTATAIGGMEVDHATVALSFANNAEDEAAGHAFALQFDTLTGGDQHNELYETSSPFTRDVASSAETIAGNNQSENDPAQEHTLFQDRLSPRNNKSLDVTGAATITMSSPTMQAVPSQLPITQPASAPSVKPRQTTKFKKAQLQPKSIHPPSQHQTTTGQSPHSHPTPQRKSPRRLNPAKGAGAVKKGTRRRHASAATPSSTTESVTTGGSTTLSSQVFSWNDILRVQNLIERCLQQCLSKDEIVATLQAQASVDPAFTAVIWQKLEEQNPLFFKAYNLQLQLKDQVVAFNYLITQQKDMMAKSLSIDSRSSGYARHGAGGGMNARNFGAPSRLGSAGRRAQQKQQLQQQQQQQSQQHQSMPSEDSTGSGVGSFPLNAAGSSGFRQSSFGSSHHSTLPLPSPIKTDLDTHAFFT